MNLIEYIHSLNDVEINEDNVKKIEDIYKNEIPEIIKKIVSSNDEPVFVDGEYRILCLREMLDPEEYLEVDFVKERLLPVIDHYDNTYVVYSFDDQKWNYYDLGDEMIFDTKDNLEDFNK